MKKPKTSPEAKPSPPIAHHNEAYAVELIARRLIAEKKQDDPDKGASMSAVVSMSMPKLDTDALRGEKIVREGRKGHAMAYGTPKEIQARKEKIRRLYVKLKLENPNWQEGRLDEEVAKQIGQSPRTVRRYKK